MRPVLRGGKPQDASGNEIEYSSYQSARGELINRLGEYCSYCEMHLDASLAVEHVQPKKPEGAQTNIRKRELDWDNFLLACTNCNSIKGNEDVVLKDYFWPDKDDTFSIFEYSDGGIIAPNKNLKTQERKKAHKTIVLTGLDRIPTNDPKVSDRRWNNRRECMEIAKRSKERLQRNNYDDFKEQIVDTAKASGFWSVWMTVFKDDSGMKQRLIDSFPGTNKEFAYN